MFLVQETFFVFYVKISKITFKKYRRVELSCNTKSDQIREKEKEQKLNLVENNPIPPPPCFQSYGLIHFDTHLYIS